jgi:hypothetical protein
MGGSTTAYATAGDAFDNWSSQTTNGELMGNVSKSVLVHRVDKSPKTSNSEDSTERGLFGPRRLTWPKEKSKCLDFECNIEFCAIGA